MIYILFGFTFLMSLGLPFVFGEFFCNRFPNTKFSKWWRKHIIYECQECD